MTKIHFINKFPSAIKRVQGASRDVLGFLADEMVSDIDKSWSSSSPSAVGDPPAVVTGRLKRNKTKRMVDPNTLHLTYRQHYAATLEEGRGHLSGRARPFGRLAVKRMKNRWGRLIKTGFGKHLK